MGLLEQSQWAEDSNAQGPVSALPQLSLGQDAEDPFPALTVSSKPKMYDPINPDERTFSAMAMQSRQVEHHKPKNYWLTWKPSSANDEARDVQALASQAGVLSGRSGIEWGGSNQPSEQSGFIQ